MLSVFSWRTRGLPLVQKQGSPVWKNGALGIIGPVRMQFPTVIPVVRYFGSMVEEVANA